MSALVKKIATGYSPRAHQHFIHQRLKRFNVLICHRRFGKTHLVVNEIIDQALRCTKKNPQYAYIAPTYGQAKRIAWDIIKEYTRMIPGIEYHEGELRVTIPRPWLGDQIKIILLGGETPDSIRGIYLDGVIMDEYAECDPRVWTQVVRAALTDRMGWAIFIGTPKGMNHLFDVLEVAKRNPGNEWFYAIFKASETQIIAASELEQSRAIMSEDEYNQEFECDFAAALVGAYYGKEMARAEKDNRITRVPYDKAVPVSTYWDLGIGDSTAIWFMQCVGRGEWHAIDYLEDSGKGLDYYAKELKQMDYYYERHVLPHDGRARSLETGRTRIETLEALGIKPVDVLERHPVEDGINAARVIMSKVWFDAQKCERGINALKNYQKKWDSKNKIYSNAPLHDWTSHGSDAFRAFAMGRVDRVGGVIIGQGNQSDLPRQAETDYDIFA